MKSGELPVDRRNFLRWVGLTAGAGITAPFLMGAGELGAPARALKAGLLAPASNAYSALAARFMRGLKAGFAGSGKNRPVNLAALDTGYAMGSAYTQAQALINAGVQIVVWPSDSPVTDAIKALFEQNQVVLLMSGVGANLPRSEYDSPYIFHHSLGYWQAAWAMGAWAAQNLGKRTWMAASLYDSGYDAHYAYRLGFESAGGEVLGSTITHRDKGDLAGLMTQIKAAKPDCVSALYCSQPAVEFMRAWAGAGMKLPLAGPGFLTSDDLLPRMGSSASGVYTAMGWSGGLKNPQEGAFSAAYLRQNAAAPDPFALVGYEAAGLIEAAMTRLDLGQAASLCYAFENLSLDTPRGRVFMPAAGHLTEGPIYLRQVQASAGRYQNVILTGLQPPAMIDPRVQAFRASLKTGWANAYLCF